MIKADSEDPDIVGSVVGSAISISLEKSFRVPCRYLTCLTW